MSPNRIVGCSGVYLVIHRNAKKLFFFFFNNPPTPEIYPLPLPDALPISRLDILEIPVSTFRLPWIMRYAKHARDMIRGFPPQGLSEPYVTKRPSLFEAAVSYHLKQDRKSTRLNSSHLVISYAVFCLKKQN